MPDYSDELKKFDITGRNKPYKHSMVCNKCGHILPAKFSIEVDKDKSDFNTFLIDLNLRPMRFSGMCEKCGIFDRFENYVSNYYIVDSHLAKITSAFVKYGIDFQFMFAGNFIIAKKEYEDCDDEGFEVPINNAIISIDKIDKSKGMKAIDSLKLDNESTSITDLNLSNKDMKMLIDTIYNNTETVVKLFSNIEFWSIEDTGEHYVFEYDMKKAFEKAIPRFEKRSLSDTNFINKIQDVVSFHLKQCDIIGETLLKSKSLKVISEIDFEFFRDYEEEE